MQLTSSTRLVLMQLTSSTIITAGMLIFQLSFSEQLISAQMRKRAALQYLNNSVERKTHPAATILFNIILLEKLQK